MINLLNKIDIVCIIITKISCISYHMKLLSNIVDILDSVSYTIIHFVSVRFNLIQLPEKKIISKKKICKIVTSCGYLEILKWTHGNGCPWNENTCSRAASSGHLKTLKWARKNGCPWNENTCSRAASGGHLETLKWARKNGCPWNENLDLLLVQQIGWTFRNVKMGSM